MGDSFSRAPAPQRREPPPRVVIEAVTPQVDDGRFPIKRIVGDEVQVAADIFTDRHDRLAATLRFRHVDRRRTDDEARQPSWREAPMQEVSNDRWSGRFLVEMIGQYEYEIEAWIDRFATWRGRVSTLLGESRALERHLHEGAALIEDAASDAAPRDAAWLREQARILEGAGSLSGRAAVAMAPTLADVMRTSASRIGVTRYRRCLRVTVERTRAGFGAWYQMFPRSAGPDPTRSATFDEAADRLPAIAAMGFDVVYLPPIHPIGRTGRKGRNNSLTAGPGDPGSPWAIGAAHGGHMSVDPGLGTVEDFERFVARARDVGLEVALDLAFHCSPDHPYVREHPEWFPRHHDDSIRNAENPPKSYEDIYPFEFDGESWETLYAELKRIVEFWIDRGVLIYRVDNPHTKPFRFWEWLIDEIRSRHPDIIFLAEAFTRPKLMRRLAKVGFSQSYTYFIWRNTKAELTSYFTELTQTGVREYLRPNLFTNTPDVLHVSLQEGGRPAFETRLILAATLGASYAIYSGYELCERSAIPGTEEYRHSEKFEFRAWDWDRPGHIKALVTRMNQIRREHPALQRNGRLSFHETGNDALLCYSKATPDGSDIVMTIVTLDPHRPQTGWVRLPIDRWGLDPTGSCGVHELLSGRRARWTGGWYEARIDPGSCPAQVWHLGLGESSR